MVPSGEIATAETCCSDATSDQRSRPVFKSISLTRLLPTTVAAKAKSGVTAKWLNNGYAGAPPVSQSAILNPSATRQTVIFIFGGLSTDDSAAIVWPSWENTKP